MTLPLLSPGRKKPGWEWRQLKVAGDDMIGLGYVNPASKSLFESSLHMTEKAPEERPQPTLRGLNLVRLALETDKTNQGQKYGFIEPNPQTSRFNVSLPRAPNHMKYTWRDRGSPAVLLDAVVDKQLLGASMGSSAEGNPPAGMSLQDTGQISLADSTRSQRDDFSGYKLNKSSLEKLFSIIDRDGSGVITQRELICTMRARPEMLKIFESVHSIGRPDAVQDSSRQPSTEIQMRHSKQGGLHDIEAFPAVGIEAFQTRLSSEQQAAFQTRRLAGEEKEKIYKMKEILETIDKDGSGTMEWEEFVDFFRQAGLLLEYKTNPDLNWTHLCQRVQVEEGYRDRRVTTHARAPQDKENRFSLKAKKASMMKSARLDMLQGIEDKDESAESAR